MIYYRTVVKKINAVSEEIRDFLNDVAGEGKNKNGGD